MPPSSRLRGIRTREMHNGVTRTVTVCVVALPESSVAWNVTVYTAPWRARTSTSVSETSRISALWPDASTLTISTVTSVSTLSVATTSNVTERHMLFGGKTTSSDAVTLSSGAMTSRSRPTTTGSWSLERHSSGAKSASCAGFLNVMS